jgi:hypothetical protein
MTNSTKENHEETPKDFVLILMQCKQIEEVLGCESVRRLASDWSIRWEPIKLFVIVSGFDSVLNRPREKT